MARKEPMFRGRNAADLKKLSIAEFSAIVPSRARRSLKRGFTDEQKKVIRKLKIGKPIETHCRDMIIIPEMVEKTIKVHDGKNFIPVMISVEMLGHSLGEFVQTRRKVSHSAPGIGATKSSASLSVK
jgi:small subunit ribosomal protein S19